MRTIVVKLYSPTNHRPARLKAWSHDMKPVWFPYEYKGFASGAQIVAQAYAAALGWSGDWVEGSLDNSTYVYTLRGWGEGFTVKEARALKAKEEKSSNKVLTD